MLMMLPASMTVGSITLADISLAQMLASLPDLDALSTSLRSGAAVTADAGVSPLPAAGLPRHRVRFERVTFAYPARTEPVLCDLDLELPFGRSLGLACSRPWRRSRAALASRS